MNQLFGVIGLLVLVVLLGFGRTGLLARSFLVAYGSACPLLLCLVLLVLICARLVLPDIARASIVGSPRFGILLILLLLVLLLFLILFVGVLLP